MGETDAIQGTVDDVIYNLWGTKEPNYVMRMMATSGRLLADETCKDTVRRWKENGEEVVKKFKYKLPCDWHFRYRHVVDDPNNLRHSLPSIEDPWVTDLCECRVFAFIFPISEVNAFLIQHYFVYCGLLWGGCLRYWSFVGSWRGNLLTIYTLGKGR